jgi:hypothetical protein
MMRCRAGHVPSGVASRVVVTVMGTPTDRVTCAAGSRKYLASLLRAVVSANTISYGSGLRL